MLFSCRHCPMYQVFSKSSSFSHCRSISDTAQLTQLFKTFQFQLLLLSLNCCCPVSDAAPFTNVLIFSVPVPAVQSPVLLLLFRYSSAYTVVPTFPFQFLLLSARHCSAYTIIRNLSVLAWLLSSSLYCVISDTAPLTQMF
jgi:hypothetical protein